MTLTRADLILEAMLTVGEMRKAGYADRVMAQLLELESAVEILRPLHAPDDALREEAMAWLREASVRARARADARRIEKRGRNSK